MLPQDVPTLPGYLCTADVQRLCRFGSRQSAVSLILSGVLPRSAVFKVGSAGNVTYLVDEKVFQRYLDAREKLIAERAEMIAAQRAYQRLRDEVRAWAIANDRPYPKRGRISERLLAEYRIAQMGDEPGAA